MNRFIAFAASALVAFCHCEAVQADFIFESAHLGALSGVPQVGIQAEPVVYQGARFSLSGDLQVESVGGNLNGSGTLFAAIVSLNSPSALPSGNPFDMTTIATTVFSPPTSGADIRVPLSATLNPGNYALIFGTGLFGASGGGFMPTHQSDIPGQSSYFFWGGSPDPSWRDSEVRNIRFVITGIPEPSSIILLGLGVLSLFGASRQRREAICRSNAEVPTSQATENNNPVVK